MEDRLTNVEIQIDIGKAKDAINHVDKNLLSEFGLSVKDGKMFEDLEFKFLNPEFEQKLLSVPLNSNYIFSTFSLKMLIV